MKKIAFGLLALSFASGCSPDQPSRPTHRIPTQLTPAPTLMETPIPPEARAQSKQFFLDFQFSDDTSTQGSSERYLALTQGLETGYRATTTIDIGKMRPTLMDLSFPFPPEVATPDQAWPTLLLGCQYGQTGDIYFKVPTTKNIRFETVHGMLRGHFFTNDQIGEVFKFCQKWPVSIQIKFLTQYGQELSYEQAYVSTDSSSPQGDL